MEQKFSDLLEGAINKLGFDLVNIIFRGNSTKTLEIFIERQDGKLVSVGDCSIVSKNISVILDVEDSISGKYFLEVSSAGVERPLVKLSDFKKFINREVKIRLKTPVNGSSSLKGKLIGTDDTKITLNSKNIDFTLDYENIKNARLVLTDEIFRELLNKKAN